MNRTTTAPAQSRTTTAPRVRRVVVVRSPVDSGAYTRRPSARRALACGVAATLVAFFAMAAAVEDVFPQLRDPEYGYRLVRVRHQQRAHPDRPLVLVIGTSRTANAINPSAMGFSDEPGSPLAFNFGLSGAQPLRQWLTLQQVRAEGVHPSAVLVELFPATLVVPGPAEHLFDDRAARLTACDLRKLEPYCDDSAPLRRRWAEDRLNAWHSHRLVFLSHLVPAWLPWPQRLEHQWTMTDQFGFSAYPSDKANELRPMRQEKTRASYHPALHHLHVSELSARAYRDLVADCRARGIPVAFYLTPESPEFRSWYTPESRAALAAFVRVLRDELNCPVFAAPTDLPEEAFADGHHMLSEPAANYSRWLADTHLRPWLAEVLKEGVTEPQP